MSATTQLWLKVGHLFGIAFWTAGLLACAALLVFGRQLGKGSESGVFAKKVALLTDLAALVAIVCGAALIIGTMGTPVSLMKNPWMHIKLTLAVVGYIGLHGYVRVKVGKAARGASSGIASFAIPMLGVLAIAIIAVAVLKPAL